MKASSDPRHNDKLRSAGEVSMLAHRLESNIEREDDDLTMQTAAQIILELEALLGHYRLDLQEILPAQTCVECSRETTHYRHRHDGPGVTCLACQALGAPRIVRAVAPAQTHDRDSVLSTAREATLSREAHHGTPEATFGTIARLWSVLLDRPVTVTDVARCMVALKLARSMRDALHGDNWVDMVGYAACGAEVAHAKRSA